MIIWYIIISYFTVAMFIYLAILAGINKVSCGDLTEAIRYFDRMTHNDLMDNAEKKFGESAETYLWMLLLMTCLLWPWVYVYEPIKKHFTK